MERKERAGIATFVMRDKEYLVAILAENGILRAVTMRFPDELRDPEDMGLPESHEPKRTNAKLEREINKLTDKKLALEDLKDDYAERLLALVHRKQRAGKDVVESAEAAEPEDDDDVPEADLLETIRHSLEAAGEKSPRNGPHKPTRKRRRTAAHSR
jgi:DNA end-binding protein Ku